MFFQETQSRIFPGEILTDCWYGAEEFHAGFIEPSEDFVDGVPGFMGIPVLIGEPDFLLRLIDVTTTHVGVEKATGFSRHREESLAESERYPCIRIVEADEDVPPWLEKPEKILESSLGIWRVVEDAGADEHVDRILCDRHGEDVPLSERDILEAETLFESLSQFQRWQAHVDANHRARLDETEEVCHLPRAAANFEDSDRWGNRPIDPEAEGAFLCLIHENSRTINIVVAGKRVSFVECLNRLPCPFLFCGYRRREEEWKAVLDVVAVVVRASECRSVFPECLLIDGAANDIHCASIPSMQWRHRTGVGVLVLALVVAASAASFLARRLLHSFPASVLVDADRSLQYTDAPFSMEEAAGIGFLTSLGAVEGYGDGTFRPGDTLNRAEFLKIVLKSSPRSSELPSRPMRCFPDVRRDDWFSPFVCFGKEQGIVSGYSDGAFRPENPVNYAEALKMLASIYEYPRTVAANDEWFSPSVRAAKEHLVFLFSDLPLATPLTRGQMARLASAFRAEGEGALKEYLEREGGEDDEESAMSTVGQVGIVGETLQQEGTVAEGEKEAQPSPMVRGSDGDVRSRQLLLGGISLPIARGTFLNPQDEAVVRRVHLRLDRKVKSLKGVHVLDAAGNELGSLRVDTNDTEERRNWILDFDISNAPRLSSGAEQSFFFAAELAMRGMGGIPGELLRVQRISLMLQNPAAGVSWEIMPAEQTFPVHQTVKARITGVRNAGEAQDTLNDGKQMGVATFAFEGDLLPETSLHLEELLFSVWRHNVDASGWRLERQEKASIECFRTYRDDMTVTCPIITEEFGILHDFPTTFILRADVKRTGDNASLQVTLDAPGSIGESGALRWSDGAGHYNWVDLPEPLAEGTKWEVK